MDYVDLSYEVEIVFDHGNKRLALNKQYSGEEHWLELVQDYVDLLNASGYIIRSKEIVVDEYGKLEVTENI